MGLDGQIKKQREQVKILRKENYKKTHWNEVIIKKTITDKTDTKTGRNKLKNNWEKREVQKI